MPFSSKCSTFKIAKPVQVQKNQLRDINVKIIDRVLALIRTPMFLGVSQLRSKRLNAYRNLRTTCVTFFFTFFSYVDTQFLANCVIIIVEISSRKKISIRRTSDTPNDRTIALWFFLIWTRWVFENHRVRWERSIGVLRSQSIIGSARWDFIGRALSVIARSVIHSRSLDTQNPQKRLPIIRWKEEHEQHTGLLREYATPSFKK